MNKLVEGVKCNVGKNPEQVTLRAVDGNRDMACIEREDGELDLVRVSYLSVPEYVGVMPTKPAHRMYIIRGGTPAVAQEISKAIECHAIDITVKARTVHFNVRQGSAVMSIYRISMILAQHGACLKVESVPKLIEPVTPYTLAIEAHRTKSVSCNLATKMAWLEGFSVLSECTGEQYCEIPHPTRSPNLGERMKYDPIGRPAIINELIQKWRVDLDWRADGSCEIGIYDLKVPLKPRQLACENTKDHNGCFATTVLTVILEAQKS